jgi:hypothetical protein
MNKTKRADIHLIDTNTIVLVHVDDDGDEVSKQFDIGDSMSPLLFKLYLQKNKIERCNCYMEEESEWQEETMDKFFESADELFTMGDYKIESSYLN